MLNFYAHFLPNLSTQLSPLHLLLKSTSSWKWGPEQQEAFEAAKSSLSSSSFLAHFNPDLPLIVSADASAYGVGAVLSHKLHNSTEQPVAFSSRTSSPAEKNMHKLTSVVSEQYSFVSLLFCGWFILSVLFSMSALSLSCILSATMACIS